MFRTQPEGVRSGPGDTDLVIYSLRRWPSLAVSGNPSVLLLFWVPDYALIVRTDEGDRLRRQTARAMIDRAARDLAGLLDSPDLPASSPLQPRPDLDAVNAYLAEAHRRAWGWAP